jgi:magnesium-protoporphyrin O-methyltransferase
MSQCQCQSIDATFDRLLAQQQLRKVRRRGPQKTTRILLEALKARGVKDRTLLDIGGGVGVIQHDLLSSGAAAVTSVDASSAYLAVSRAEAERLGHAGRIHYYYGNFVELAPGIPPADIVTLDRVICCFDEMEVLVGVSSAKARGTYGVVYPRSAWWVRLGVAIANLSLAVRGNPFRIFTHDSAAVEEVIRAQGLTRVSHHTSGMWQVVVFARAS